MYVSYVVGSPSTRSSQVLRVAVISKTTGDSKATDAQPSPSGEELTGIIITHVF